MNSFFKQPGSLLIFLALCVLGFLAYGQTIAYPFVHDDVVFIQQNPRLAFFDWKNIFQGTVISVDSSPGINAYYRPLLELLYRVEYVFFGLNPSGYHFLNILFHIANSFLVYWLVNVLAQGRKGFALAAAVLFLLHPVQSEAVACISGISNLLFAFLVLAGLYFYLRNSVTSHVLSLLAFALALLAKEQAVVLPILIVLLEIIYPLSVTRPILPRAVRIGGYFVVLIIYFLVRKILLPEGTMPAIAFNYELFLRVLSIPRTVLMYLGTIFLPYDLHYYRSVDILRPNGASIIAFLIVLGAVVWTILKVPQPYRRLLLWGAGWFGITLLPVLNIVPLINEYSLILTAEHFLYLPLLGVLLFVLGLGDLFLGRMPERRRAILAKGGVCVLAVILGAAAIRQSTCWAGEIPLFERTVRFEKALGRAHILLARAYYKNGEYAKAIGTYRRALAIMDGYLAKVGSQPAASVYLGFVKEIHFDLAHCFEGLGDFQEAVNWYLRALVIDHNDAVVHNNLGIIYLKLGDQEKAAAHFREIGK
ncbi:MAG: tetratricopeptide repeat protein [Candidatus Omnitrophica bacterium]|nr:tetratricopeptide repeat protein [Candidatus Omnitrophota bacterium]